MQWVRPGDKAQVLVSRSPGWRSTQWGAGLRATMGMVSAGLRTACITKVFPTRDDTNWFKHTLAWMDEDGGVTIDYRPVHMHTLSNEIDPVPPKARVY